MDGIAIDGRAQFVVTAGTQSAPLEAGVYDVWSASDAYIKVGADASGVSSANGYLIPGGKGIVPVRIAATGLRLGAAGADVAVHRVA
jgi:hypothetical protein